MHHRNLTIIRQINKRGMMKNEQVNKHQRTYGRERKVLEEEDKFDLSFEGLSPNC